MTNDLHHLSTDELVIIESYFHHNISVSKISGKVKRAHQTVRNVVAFLKDGHIALDFYKRYRTNKQLYRWKQTRLPDDQHACVEEKVAHYTACSNAKALMCLHCRWKANRNPMAIRSAEGGRPSDGNSLTEIRTIQHSKKNLDIWKAIPLSASIVKVPLWHL